LGFQVGLGVGQFCCLAIESTRLEGLALQRRVEHQQSGHAQSEDADQHEKERESSQASGRLRDGVKWPTSRSGLVTTAGQRRRQCTHPATAIAAMRSAARRRAEAARGLRAISACAGSHRPAGKQLQLWPKLRRNHGHVTRCLILSGYAEDLFDQAILERVIGEYRDSTMDSERRYRLR
jgi:hypothetical protein